MRTADRIFPPLSSGAASRVPAVANPPLAHATGVRIKELPLAPERVLRAVQTARRT